MRFCRTVRRAVSPALISGARWTAIAVLLAIGLGAFAAPGYTVQQIKSFVESAVQLKNPDKEVAEMLRKMKLSERLDLDVVETLQSEGAGPKTVAALKELAAASASLAAAVSTVPKPAYVPPPPPSSEEQAQLIDEVREYATNYSKMLPDFICLEQTRRYVDTTGKEYWRAADVITARLTYFNQKEEYKLVSAGDRPVTDESYTSVGGAQSMGDFGTTMREIFETASQTSFAWDHWGRLRNRHTYVFSYRVPLEYSKYTIAYRGEAKDDEQRITVGYHGLVHVDQESKMVVRITTEADNIPATFPVQQAKETLDYDFTKIGDREFLLPLVADMRMHSGRIWSKNVKEFRLYRKFSADAVIKFNGEDLGPLPDDKTQEQPPQPQTQTQSPQKPSPK